MKTDHARTLLKEKFPEAHDEIDERLQAESIFCEMSNDYDVVYQMLQQLQEKNKSLRSAEIEAFQELLSELETDLVRYFKRGPPA